MAISYQTYTGNGSVTTFPISFDWIYASDVVVTVDGYVKINGTDYNIVNKNVVFTTAPTNGTLVKVARSSNLTSRNVDFVNGSRLDESDLDNSAKQLFYLIQEIKDQADALSTQLTNAAAALIVDGSVTNTKLASDSVTTSKVADGTLTPAKLSSGKPTWDTSGNLTATSFVGPLTGNASTATKFISAPAFRAYSSTNQSLAATTITKLILGLEEYDTNSAFDVSTYRFTPLVAGYYIINGRFTVASATAISAFLYKNGTEYSKGTFLNNGTTATVNSLVYLNGTTDYVEFYGYAAAASTVNPASFDGVLVKPA